MSTEEEREFQRVVTEGLVPRLKDSAVCVTITPDDGSTLDAKFCVELGAMILLDKPILAIVAPGRTLSKKFEAVADKVVHADITTPEGQEILREAIEDFGIQYGGHTT